MKVSLFYQQKRFQDVIQIIESKLNELHQKGWTLLWIRLQPIHALSLQALSRVEEALEVLGKCLAAAEPEGFIRMFVERGAPMAALLKSARERGLNTKYTSKLLESFNLPEEALKPTRTGAATLPPAGASLVEPLSERELEVIRLLNSHLSVPEIASQMLIAPSTLRTHTRNIYQKLNVHGRLEALQKARDLGLL